jgi:hypothetical protein
MSLVGRMTPRHRVQSPAIGRAIESREKGGEKHIQFKPSRIGSIGNTWQGEW